MFWTAVSIFMASKMFRARICFLILFVVPVLAYEAPLANENTSMKHDIAENIISAVLTDEIDYLKNQENIKAAFETSRAKNWTDLQLEAAVAYSELLFRQERYEDQIKHIEEYLPKIDPEKKRRLYLLLLESKIRYLARVKNQAEADKILSEFEAMQPDLLSSEKIIVHRSLAYHYTAFDLIEKNLETAVAGLALSEAIDDHGSSGFFLQKISDAHNILGKKEEAIGFAQRAVNEYEKTGDAHLTAKSYWSLGNTLLELKKIEGGLFYFKRALNYFKDVGMQKGIVFAQYSIANIEHSRAKYEESLEILKDNIDRAEKAGIGDMQLASMILKKSVYAKQERWDESNEVSDSIVPLIDRFSRTHYKANFFMERYKLKKLTNRYDEAFNAIEEHIKYSEKHLKSVNNNSVEALRNQLELREKEAEIDKLAQEKSISELRAKEESQEKIIWRLSAAIAAILLIAFLLLFYWQFRERKKMQAISIQDELTKAINRRGILAIAKEAMYQNKTIALIDLDYFKKVNDEFGHDTGDEVLIAFADAARQALRDSDSFGRYGGEEWLFILDAIEEQGIQTIFDRLKGTYQRIIVEKDLGEISKKRTPTFSMGAIRCGNTEIGLEEAIKQADQMLYKAKDSGRDQLVIA